VTAHNRRAHPGGAVLCYGAWRWLRAFLLKSFARVGEVFAPMENELGTRTR